MQENAVLQPNNIIQADGVIVRSYEPDITPQNGACLALALIFAGAVNSPYKFEIMMIRKTSNMIEPMIYKDHSRLNFKEICQDITRFFSGNFSSIYVQMDDTKSGTKIGAVFWNAQQEQRSFSIAFRPNGQLNIRRLESYISQVYFSYINNKDTILKMLKLPDFE